MSRIKVGSWDDSRDVLVKAFEAACADRHTEEMFGPGQEMTKVHFETTIERHVNLPVSEIEFKSILELAGNMGIVADLRGDNFFKIREALTKKDDYALKIAINPNI